MFSRASFGGTLVFIACPRSVFFFPSRDRQGAVFCGKVRLRHALTLAIAMFCVTNAVTWAQPHQSGRSRDTNQHLDGADNRSLSEPALQAESTAAWWLTAEAEMGTLIWQNPFAQVDGDVLHLLRKGSTRSSDVRGWSASSDVGEDGWSASSNLGQDGFGDLPAGFWYNREKEVLYAYTGSYSLRDALRDVEVRFNGDAEQLIAEQPLLLEVLWEHGIVPGGGGWVEADAEFFEEMLGWDAPTAFRILETCWARNTEEIPALTELSEILREFLETLLATRCGSGCTGPCCGSSDPCCGNPDPCCGSSDPGCEEGCALDEPCCASTDPCCGSSDRCCNGDDPCCGSSDPCCNGNDPCCGNPYRCCNDDNPCCGSSDPCCNTSDPCCGDSDRCCNPDNPCCGSSHACCNTNAPCCGDPDPCCNPHSPCCGATAGCSSPELH